MQSGFTGISYPFRITNRGGVAMSTTGIDNPSHIVESIEQIFGTNYLERPMESDVYTSTSLNLFDPNDMALQRILKVKIVEDLEKLEPRISCSEDEIEFEVTHDEEGTDYLYATITFKIIKYMTTYTAKIRMGEVNNEQETY